MNSNNITAQYLYFRCSTYRLLHKNREEARLLIDRIEIPLEKFPLQGPWEVLDVGSNEVQIGGLNTSDPRLKIYKGYNGCLSSKYYE